MAADTAALQSTLPLTGLGLLRSWCCVQKSTGRVCVGVFVLGAYGLKSYGHVGVCARWGQLMLLTTPSNHPSSGVLGRIIGIGHVRLFNHSVESRRQVP